jgi:NADH dehydrogenase [ubiquinone] 1 alpha subcomplex assembly factor 5
VAQVDTDQIVVPYPDALSLMHELRGMGESNAVTMRRGFLPRHTLLAAAAIYDELYGDVLDDGAKVIPATFELLYMIGWAPGANQPAALERGALSPTQLCCSDR